MSAVQLFLSSHGRIGRAQWWIGIVAVAVLYVSGQLVGVSVHHSDGFAAGQFVQAALNAPVLYLAYCVMAKRCHDCGERPIWALVAVMLGSLEIGWDIAEAAHQFGRKFVNDTHLVLLAARATLAPILVVMLGCRRGTSGDNRYGPDPIARAHSEPPQSVGQVSVRGSNVAR